MSPTVTRNAPVLPVHPQVAACCAALADAAVTCEPASVANLRAQHQRNAGPSLQQVTRIVNGVMALESRDAIAAAAGMDPDEVLTCVAALGTWLRHIRGAMPFDLVRPPTADQQLLWQPDVQADSATQVVIPPGFERAGSGRRRDVTKALGSLVVSRPTDEELARWVARRTPATTEAVEWTLVTIVHTFGRLGRIEELDAINPESFELSQALCRAWDLLETSRVTALDAAARVLSASAPDPADLAAARVLHEAGFARLERVLTARSDLLEREKARLALALLDGLIPTSIGELTAAQVRRIAQLAGLTVEVPNRTEEAEVRRRLDDLGLARDADQLVPAAVRAINSGLEEAFWEAMQLRADGVEDWQAPLRAAAS